MGRELSRLYLANLFDLSGHVAAVTAALAAALRWAWLKRDLPSQFWRATRRARPDECADAAAFLASRDSDLSPVQPSS